MIINAIIPAKGNSQRVSNKNLLKINNKTLVFSACEKLLKSNKISNVYLDTDSDEIINDVNILINHGLNIIKRPEELANNDINANDLMIWGLHNSKECDLMLQTFCTSPSISVETIDRCIDVFLENSEKYGYDSFFTVVEMQEYLWASKNFNPINFDLQKLPNSFELEPILMETHGLYGIFTDILIKKKNRVGDKPYLVKISKLESFDINVEEDIEILKGILS